MLKLYKDYVCNMKNKSTWYAKLAVEFYTQLLFVCMYLLYIINPVDLNNVSKKKIRLPIPSLELLLENWSYLIYAFVTTPAYISYYLCVPLFYLKNEGAFYFLNPFIHHILTEFFLFCSRPPFTGKEPLSIHPCIFHVDCTNSLMAIPLRSQTLENICLP